MFKVPPGKAPNLQERLFETLVQNGLRGDQVHFRHTYSAQAAHFLRAVFLGHTIQYNHTEYAVDI